MSEFTKYSRARLDDRQVTELIGMARGMIADGQLVEAEAEYLHKWLAATDGLTSNPLVSSLYRLIEAALEDGVMDSDERVEIFEALHSLAGEDFEIGEAIKSSTLPLCDPAPVVLVEGARFTFTGAFTFGSRRECEAAVFEKGGSAGSLRRDTAFLVIGEYASDDWIHSTYGRKIEKAVALRDAGNAIHIISEKHWRSSINA